MTGQKNPDSSVKPQLAGMGGRGLAAVWRKSSYSNHQSACVEVANFDQDAVGFRDSKDPEGPVLTFTRSEAVAFVAAVSGGEFTGCP